MSECVSVLMPVYNADSYLRESIDSILNQTHREIEFIILDDGSSDRSAEIVSQYKDSRIRFVRNDSNLKICKTLNRGIELAQGDYIARMDSDDVAYPERIATQLKFLRANPEIAGAGTRIRTTLGTVWRHPTSPDELHATNYFANSLCHPTLLIRADVLRDRSLRYDEEYLYAEEWDLWFRIMRSHRLANVPNVLLDVRRFEGSSSQTFRAEQISAITRVLKREWAFLRDNVSDNEVDCIVRYQSLGQAAATYDELQQQGQLLVRKAFHALEQKFPRRTVAGVINRQLHRLHTSSRISTSAASRSYLQTIHCADRLARPIYATGWGGFLMKRVRKRASQRRLF